MFVAVDDTDSMKGNCTTFLATEIIREFMDDLDLIGNPRLVRLNPAVPWKTRGNGSLVMRFGKGTGPKRFIGRIGGRDVFCYDRCTSFEPDPVMMRDRIIPHIEDHHEDKADGETDGGEVGMGALRGFGDEFFDHHIQHRTCSKRQQIRHCGHEE